MGTVYEHQILVLILQNDGIGIKQIPLICQPCSKPSDRNVLDMGEALYNIYKKKTKKKTHTHCH